jgi:hypothetical protein
LPNVSALRNERREVNAFAFTPPAQHDFADEEKRPCRSTVCRVSGGLRRAVAAWKLPLPGIRGVPLLRKEGKKKHSIWMSVAFCTALAGCTEPKDGREEATTATRSRRSPSAPRRAASSTFEASYR